MNRARGRTVVVTFPETRVTTGTRETRVVTGHRPGAQRSAETALSASTAARIAGRRAASLRHTA